MRATETLTNLVTGAAASIIALSSVAQGVVLSSPALNSFGAADRLWPMILATGVATLLVMSVLHSNLETLYQSLADAEARAKYDARRDPLTKLGNRKLLLESLDHRLNNLDPGKTFAFLLMDLDQFKKVNDTLGHGVGDSLIVEVSDRLSKSVPDAVLARLGGDEFALIVQVQGPDDLDEKANRILSICDSAIAIEGHRLAIGFSIGGAFLDSYLTPSELLRRADIAMYKAKSDGGGFRLIDDEMLAEIERQATIGRRLRHALESQDGIELHYQPQLSRDGEAVALEALLRWSDSELGAITPQEAIAVAEESHLINALGLLVVELACEAAARFPDLAICMNIASKQLLDVRFWQTVSDQMRASAIEPKRFHLEIPELVLVDRHHAIAPTLLQLSRLGFTLVLDNYGTGSASLSFARRNSFSRIKLDRTFLADSRRFKNVAIMRAKVALAESLGMQVVCVGISDLEDQTLAVQAGCHYLQGYYFGEPMPLELVATHMSQQPAMAATNG